jgi:hypothetical protein
MKKRVSEFYVKNLLLLKDELDGFINEQEIWKTLPGVNNSAGNLTLHLLGNLNHFIGNVIGKSNFQRDRDKEFSNKNISREKLISEINETIKTIETALNNINNDDLEKDYPLDIFGNNSILFYLIHFNGHFNYHLGQINYIKRIIQG